MRVEMQHIWCSFHVDLESSSNLQCMALKGCERLQQQLLLDAHESFDSMMHHDYQTSG